MPADIAVTDALQDQLDAIMLRRRQVRDPHTRREADIMYEMQRRWDAGGESAVQACTRMVRRMRGGR